MVPNCVNPKLFLLFGTQILTIFCIEFGWWFAGGMGVSFIIGVAFGMIKNMHPDPEKRTPIPGSAAKYAIKALLYGSVLCTSVAAVTAYGTSKALGVKNVRTKTILNCVN